MKHECAVPNGSGGKKQTWRCPTCRKVWDYQPGRNPGLGLINEHRNADGSKPNRWWQ